VFAHSLCRAIAIRSLRVLSDLAGNWEKGSECPSRSAARTALGCDALCDGLVEGERAPADVIAPPTLSAPTRY
jgi:hypothetical protein